MDPCDSFSYGGVKDFTVSVTSPLSPVPSPTLGPSTASAAGDDSFSVHHIPTFWLVAGSFLILAFIYVCDIWCDCGLVSCVKKITKSKTVQLNDMMSDTNVNAGSGYTALDSA